MTQTRRRFPESFKREAVDQVLAGTPLRHVAETLGIAESLLGKWKRQYEQQGDDAFPGNGKQRGESAELRRLRRQLAQVTMERDVLKRRSPSSRSPRSEVSRHRGVGWSLPRSTDVPVVAGVAQRFYAWQQRPPSVREMANRRLSKEIRTIHHEVNGIYGHRRIKAELTAMGQACGRHRVARLMREAGLRVRSRKRWRLVSSSRHDLPIAPNHLDRQFVSDRANRHWVSDMTYVRTAQGWLYLAVVLDLYSRAVVGWAMHHRMQQALVHAALEMAVARRQPQAEVLLHSDRGSQYCAYDYQALLRRHRIVPSHSRPGNCWDNAAMESFFRSLKAERVYLTRYASYQEAKTDLFDYIRFYNHRRRHSTLGYLSPMEFERRYASSNS